jgi:hypothetical protein
MLKRGEHRSRATWLARELRMLRAEHAAHSFPAPKLIVYRVGRARAEALFRAMFLEAGLKRWPVRFGVDALEFQVGGATGLRIRIEFDD